MSFNFDDLTKLITVFKSGTGDIKSIIDDIEEEARHLSNIAASIAEIADDLGALAEVGKRIIQKVEGLSKKL